VSKYHMRGEAKTLHDIMAAKAESRKLSVVTCYDSAFARLIDRTPLDIVLVGDSLGNVMMGYDDTVKVSLDDMVHHTACVSRVLQKPFLVSDMPFFSYKVSTTQALESAARLVQEGGAQAVKLEGGEEIAESVEAITKAGIPVMGHLGLTPQSVHVLGGYKVQGRGQEAETRLLEDAKALEQAGAFAIVLELIPAELAKKVSSAISIPTIGIGAGVGCDGQVLVLQDLLGFDDGFSPKFLKKYAQVGEMTISALCQFDKEVKNSEYPAAEHSFSE